MFEGRKNTTASAAIACPALSLYRWRQEHGRHWVSHHIKVSHHEPTSFWSSVVKNKPSLLHPEELKFSWKTATTKSFRINYKYWQNNQAKYEHSGLHAMRGSIIHVGLLEFKFRANFCVCEFSLWWSQRWLLCEFNLACMCETRHFTPFVTHYTPVWF